MEPRRGGMLVEHFANCVIDAEQVKVGIFFHECPK